MQFIDLAFQQQRIKDKIDVNIQAVLKHGSYILGPEVFELERRLGNFSEVRHAIGCASGTDALLAALMAFGVGRGDAVFLSPFTFIATAEVIALLGATPVFVDVDPRTFNIDADQLFHAIEATLAAEDSAHPLPGVDGAGPLAPKAVIAVDLFGLPADYQSIREITRENGLFLIGDAAQSFGSELYGRKAITYSDIACTSFFPAKPLGCYGDGGMCFTDDDTLAQSIRSICVHGKGTHKYDNIRIGINGRLDTLQAAILLAKFGLFAEEIELRQVVAERYTLLLSEIPGITLPTIPEGYRSVWAQYSILADSAGKRTELQNALKAADIPTSVYYPLPLHMQQAFAYLRYSKGDFPVSEALAETIFSLPMHPYLSKDQQSSIAKALLEPVAA